MKSTALTARNILLVNGAAKLLRSICKSIPASERKEWDFRIAATLPEAMATLQAHSTQLLLLNFSDSTSDMLHFLRDTQARFPQLHKVVLLAGENSETMQESLRAGADLCLRTPGNRRAFEHLFQCLNQLLAQSQEGFRGMLRKASLTDLIQIECINARSSVLEITSESNRGDVFIRQGRIIHAQAGSKTGVEAFTRLMRMTGGEFQLIPFFEPAARTIDMSRDQLLLEAVHSIDESRGNKDCGALKDGHTAWFQSRQSSAESTPLKPDLQPGSDSLLTTLSKWLIGVKT